MAGRHSHIAYSVPTSEPEAIRPVAPLRPLTGIPDPPELPPGSDSRLAHYLLEGYAGIVQCVRELVRPVTQLCIRLAARSVRRHRDDFFAGCDPGAAIEQPVHQ